MSTYEPMVAFNLNNGPFLKTLAPTLENLDISNLYNIPDTNAQCRIPREDPLVLPQQNAYLQSTVPKHLSFQELHCRGVPMTVTTGSLPKFVTLTNNVLYFDPTTSSQSGTHQFSITVTDPDGRAISSTVSVLVSPNQVPYLNKLPLIKEFGRSSHTHSF